MFKNTKLARSTSGEAVQAITLRDIQENVGSITPDDDMLVTLGGDTSITINGKTILLLGGKDLVLVKGVTYTFSPSVALGLS